MLDTETNIPSLSSKIDRPLSVNIPKVSADKKRTALIVPGKAMLALMLFTPKTKICESQYSVHIF